MRQGGNVARRRLNLGYTGLRVFPADYSVLGTLRRRARRAVQVFSGAVESYESGLPVIVVRLQPFGLFTFGELARAGA